MDLRIELYETVIELTVTDIDRPYVGWGCEPDDAMQVSWTVHTFNDDVAGEGVHLYAGWCKKGTNWQELHDAIVVEIESTED